MFDTHLGQIDHDRIGNTGVKIALHGSISFIRTTDKRKGPGSQIGGIRHPVMLGREACRFKRFLIFSGNGDVISINTIAVNN